MLIQKPEPVPNKLCSRCNTQKTCEDFYRDASKPDGLQVPLSAYRTPLDPTTILAGGPRTSIKTPTCAV
jgi:hypothetical protein